ncbi:hypothetical protein IT411_04055 [Candidatus Peregrinibacteria bacterium]|nr:hypothetical protein [Candidatus Peregrinibacteria bacterium]
MIPDKHKPTVSVIKKAAEQGLGPAGIFAGVAGFFSDFVKPLINLVPYFFVGSLAAALILWFGFIAKDKKPSEIDTLDEILKSRHGILFGVTVLSTAFWLVMMPIFAFTPAEGVVASTVPQVGEAQHMMMARFDLIDAKLDKGFAAVLDKIDQIDANAGIINNPQSYNDYYHNARVQELSGNLLEARKAYEKYFETNLGYYDPYLSYAQIIKAIEGPSSVGEFLGKLRDKYSDNPAAALIYAVNKSAREDKEFLLNELTKKFPDYGPIYFAQLELYSYKESGVPTLAEQAKAQEALGKLQDLEKKQQFSQFFIDKKLLAEKEEFIKSQASMADSYYGSMTKNPIDFKIEYVNGSVSMSFVPMEMVKKIFYRVDGEGEFKDTGSMGIAMPGSTESLPNYNAIEPLEVGKHVVEVKYVDVKDKESPVYKFDFEITPLKIDFMGFKIQNPRTGKAGPYLYYNFYNPEDGNGTVSYSFDTESYDQTGDGMIFLDSLNPGKHVVYFQTRLANGEVLKQQKEVEIN